MRRAMIRRATQVALSFVLLVATSCSSLPIVPRGPLDTEAAYTSIFPYYLEFCALSEVMKKPGYGADIRGGIGGHSTLYLNGVCRVGDGYPEVALCGGSDPGADGVGFSVNAHFANAKWVAVPGRNFFYRGDLGPDERLTRAVYDETKAHAKQLRLYDSIRFHNVVFDDMPPGYARDAFKYEVSIATDYALGYGRDRYCARVPMSREQMARVVAYMNAQNQPYREGRQEFEWSVITDNCIHLAHNALTAIGFWKAWPIHMFFLYAIFDFPVPKNEFVNIMRRSNDMNAADLLSDWNDAATRDSVLAGDGLPAREGALAVLQPVVADNDLYDTKLRLIFYDERMLGPYEGWYRRIVRESRYSDMQANLEYFDTFYARIESGRQPLSWWLSAHPDLRDEPRFTTFYTKFYDEIAQHATAVSAARARLQAGG
jgi:hypothetical protein